MKEFNLESSTQLSVLLFGGSIKEKVKEPIMDINGDFVLYKSGQNIGQIKTRMEEKERQIKGLGLNPIGQIGKNGNYSTSEEILLAISRLFRDDKEAIDIGIGSKIGIDAKKLVLMILENRGIKKEISTYYDGIENKLYKDNCVRPNINHTGTATMRLSFSIPNLQNIPRGEE